MFDYIIIGAGTAGCVLAARLSEIPENNVLLIEAGPPDRDRGVRTPLAFPKLFRTPLDWDFWTEPQEHLDGRRLYWPRGKTIGGSGSIGAMIHLDACREDLNPWRELGNPGWGYDDLSPLRDNPLASAAAPVPQPNPLSEAFLKACAEAGVPPVSVLTDASQPAAGLFRVNIRNGVRWSAADAYLRPALQRGNLTVWTGIQVKRLLFETSSTGAPRAVAVEFLQDGALRQVEVVHEIVLCAGAVGSPHLLLLSGVGDPEQLREFEIPVVMPLAGVGENLQDHLAAPVSFFSKQPVSLSGAGTFLNRLQHRLHSTGPMASNGAEAGALIKSRPELTACDLEIIFAPVHFVDHGFAEPGGHGFTLVPSLLTPMSRGRIRLGSTDAGLAPLIEPRYLSGDDSESELTALIAGVRFVQRLVGQEALAAYCGTPSQGQVFDSDDSVRAHVLTWAQTEYHPVGTCRMGPAPVDPGDMSSVVDHHLCVHGITGLRVADASIMPVIPRANTNATTVLVAEKAALLMKRT